MFFISHRLIIHTDKVNEKTINKEKFSNNMLVKLYHERRIIQDRIGREAEKGFINKMGILQEGLTNALTCHIMNGLQKGKLET